MIYVALLHSIVLGPGRRVVMADLRDLAERAGYRNCRTLASTGNMVFEADESGPGDIEQMLETAFQHRFGKHVSSCDQGLTGEDLQPATRFVARKDLMSASA